MKRFDFTKKNTILAFRDIIVGLVFAITTISLSILFGFWAELLESKIQESDITTATGLIREYGGLSLTLFGFTLIGGIFAGKKEKNKSKKPDALEKTKAFLLFSSLLLLLAFIMFNILYLIIYPETNLEYSGISPYIFRIGIGCFIFGIFLLFLILAHFLIMRYTTIPKRWKKFWGKHIKDEKKC